MKNREHSHRFLQRVLLGLPTENRFIFPVRSLGGVKVPTLFAVDIDGENPKKLTDAGQVCEEPDGSPDGQWIAYVSVQDGSKDISLIRADGGGLRKLTEDPGLEFSPAWVPSVFSVSPSANAQMVPWGILKQPTPHFVQ